MKFKSIEINKNNFFPVTQKKILGIPPIPVIKLGLRFNQ